LDNLALVFNVLPHTTIAVKSHVSITLELKRPNFTPWSTFFLSLCSKFALPTHNDDKAVVRPDVPAWAVTDSYVHNWFCSSIADNILGLTLELDQMARQLFIMIEGPFQANKAPCDIFLSHEFHSMT
jgi:hypothetical protein